MSELIDLTGKKFGKLTVLKRVENNKHRQPQWLCKCDCGNEAVVAGQKLRTGHTKSCGCIIFEQKTRLTHGMTSTTLFTRWMNMKSRCNNPKNKRYNRYGGRGIKVCEEWENDFMSFYRWAISNGFEESLSIDRIDNNMGYCPENCRWVNAKRQANNTSKNVKIVYNGEKKTLAEWCDSLNVDYKLIHNRMHRYGMTFQDAVSKPVRHSHSRDHEPLSHPDKDTVHPSPSGPDSKDTP